MDPSATKSETQQQAARGRGGRGGRNNNNAGAGGGSNRCSGSNEREAGGEHPPSGSHQQQERGGRPRFQRDYKQLAKKKLKDRNDHNGVPMGDSQEECILCCQKSDLFGIANCRHPACMECVIRMRCQGKTTTCHACREEVPLMTFVRRPPDVNWSAFEIPRTKVPHPDAQKHDIAFEDAHVAMCYDKYIAFSCSMCPRDKFSEFPTFGALKQHMGSHQRFYCHICEENLNLLPKDRELYMSKELKTHIEGQHPMCDFCKDRYYDDEALFLHSRQKHFFCTLCAQDGHNTFFNRIDQVQKHYKQVHFPCLDPNCLQLGIVFRNEVDLNAHKIEQHGGTDRKVQIDVQFSRNSNRYRSPPNRLANHTSSGIALVPSNHPVREPPTNIIPSAQFSGLPVHLVPPAPVRQADFPSLAPSAAANAFAPGTNWRAGVQASRDRATGQTQPTVKEQLESTSHFPTLSGPGASSANTPAGVWGGSKLNKIKQPPKPAAQKKHEPEVPRKRVIPLPAAWPESMRRKLEAREQGLPEPPDDFPTLNTVPKKKKEPKKKTVSADAVQKRIADGSAVAGGGGNSKFNALAAVGSPTDENTVDTWLSATALKAKQKKAEKKKAEKAAKQEEEKRKAEEEELKKKDRLTHEKFLAEMAEAKRKEQEAKERKEAEEKFLEEHADDVVDVVSSSQNQDDPMLQLLMQQFHNHSTSVQTDEDRLNARMKSLLGASLNERPPTTATTIVRESSPLQAGEPSSANHAAVAPPPGFENFAPPPGFGRDVPPGFSH